MIVSRLLRLCLAAGFLLLPGVLLVPHALAHEIRPAYLEINRIGPDRYDVLWRTPVSSGKRLPVVLRLPDGIANVTTPVERPISDSVIERRLIDAPGGLAGKRIEFVGLQATITDVLVRIEMEDGTHTAIIVRPSRPFVDVPEDQGMLAIAVTYLGQGVEHILFGLDHLLFVLGLLLLVKNSWMLVKTITAFTVAHSVTLAAATLGFVHIPEAPLNAAIALSILFVGVEVVHSWRSESSFTLRHPWVVAFAFGLLHGFGFASGLTTLGLPGKDIPLALLSFNIGVEIGQLVFVAGILLLERAFRLLEIHWPAPMRALPAYAVGSLGAYWTIDRVAAMLGGSG